MSCACQLINKRRWWWWWQFTLSTWNACTAGGWLVFNGTFNKRYNFYCAYRVKIMINWQWYTTQWHHNTRMSKYVIMLFQWLQGHCGARRRKWQLTDTDLCPCGETQTMFHIVESCPLTKLNGGLSRLHCAHEGAVLWLTSYGSWHAYEKKKDFMIVNRQFRHSN